MGIDPLTLVADMLTVAVIDSDVFDEPFTNLVTANEEGQILTGHRGDGASIGLPFDAGTVERRVAGVN